MLDETVTQTGSYSVHCLVGCLFGRDSHTVCCEAVYFNTVLDETVTQTGSYSVHCLVGCLFVFVKQCWTRQSHRLVVTLYTVW